MDTSVNYMLMFGLWKLLKMDMPGPSDLLSSSCTFQNLLPVSDGRCIFFEKIILKTFLRAKVGNCLFEE